RPFAGAPSPERDRRAAPWRSLEAREPAHPLPARPASTRRWHHPRLGPRRPPLQPAAGLPRAEATAGGGDQGIHRNPATLVAPRKRDPALDLSHEETRDDEARDRDTQGVAPRHAPRT